MLHGWVLGIQISYESVRGHCGFSGISMAMKKWPASRNATLLLCACRSGDIVGQRSNLVVGKFAFIRWHGAQAIDQSFYHASRSWLELIEHRPYRTFSTCVFQRMTYRASRYSRGEKGFSQDHLGAIVSGPDWNAEQGAGHQERKGQEGADKPYAKDCVHDGSGLDDRMGDRGV